MKKSVLSICLLIWPATVFAGVPHEPAALGESRPESNDRLQVALETFRQENDVTRQTVDPETAFRSVRDLTIARLQIPAVPRTAFQTPMVLEGVRVTLELAPYSVRAPSFKVEIRDGRERPTYLDPGPVRTVRGTVREIPGSQIAGIVLDRGFEGTVELPGNVVLWLEPVAKQLAGAGRDLYAISPCGLEESGKACGLVGSARHGKGLESISAASNGQNCAALGGCVAEILCDTDYGFYSVNGNSASQVQSTVEGLMALAVPRFQDPFAITHQISTIVVRPVEAQDPYSDPSITTAGGLLAAVAQQWPQGSHTSDLVHLFTTHFFGGTVGLAYLGGVCSSSSMFSLSAGGSVGCNQAGVLIHELGHSWGANHTQGGIMDQFPGDCNAAWCCNALTEIPATRDAAAGICLDLAAQPRNAQVLSQSVPTTMAAGRIYPVSVTLKNIGTLTWSPIGSQCNAFRLGSANPYNNGTWVPTTRVELPAPVAPGGQVTLSFNVTAPSTPGTYNFQWQMLQECVVWFGDFTPNVVVTVQAAPPRDAQVLSQSVPTSMVAGEAYPVSVTLKNVGTQSWSPIGSQCNAFRLGSANPYNNGTWVPVSRVELPAPVAPGGQMTLSFTVTAPSTPGTYNFQWQMVQECVVWFGDFTPNVSVTVQAASRNSQFLSQSVPASMVAGGTYPVSVTFKNTGNNTWSPIGPSCGAYRLGSANPYNNGTWVPVSRVELPAPVAPGGQVTFSFNVTAPSTPGTYNFQWQMVQECVTWFGDFSPNLAVTVSP